MRHFLLFLGGLVAGIVLLLNLGPMILFGLSIWLLYLVFKQFMKSDSTFSKIVWIVLGLIILSISISNIYAVMGVAAAAMLYWIYKNWHTEKPVVTPFSENKKEDPFMNFEREWQELSK